MSVFDELLASTSGFRRIRINKIIRYIQTNHPRAICCICFCTPGFRYNGYFIGFQCLPDELSIYITNKNAVAETALLYPKVRTTKNSIRFYDSESFNSSAVKAAIDICFLCKE